jgi:hypothetical protein
MTAWEGKGAAPPLQPQSQPRRAVGPSASCTIGPQPSAAAALVGSTRCRADVEGGGLAGLAGLAVPLADAVPASGLCTAPVSVGAAAATSSRLLPLPLGPRPDFAAAHAIAAADASLQPQYHRSATASSADMLSAGEPSRPAGGARRGRGARGGRAAPHTARARMRRRLDDACYGVA